MDYEKERINGLIVQLRNGDKSAFDEFYKLTSPKAYFIALKITRNEHDAEDVLQESYIKALEKLDEIDVSQNAMNWFFKIVSNKSKDLIKSNTPVVFESEDENFFEDIPEDKAEFCPEENLNQEELRLEVMAAIDELTDEKRACIMMMYFGEMSVKEIAESIEVPESTVKNRLYTARKDLKNKFEKSGNVLYGAALGGVIIWALQKTSVTASAAFAASAASANILAGIGASAVYSAATTASAAATTAAATATTAAATSTAATTAAATATGIGAKVAALSVVQKVAVGIAATAVIGGGTAGVATVVKTVTNDPEPTTLAEEVTTSPFVTSEDAFNGIVATTAPTAQETSTTDVSSTTSAATLTERSTKPVTTAKPTTTRAHTTQKPLTTQKETTTKQETTTQRVTTTVPATQPTTVPTTVPTTQAAATMTVDVIDMDGSVIETLSFSVPAGTTLTKAYIIDNVRSKNYEPMAGVYGSDVGTVAQSGQTYHFEAEL
ncbi:MAG: RNA polymerase sigma factor [Clostridia bacterium]|nr:RNA polymerase sigma factor [Clostridia bacterium]